MNHDRQTLRELLAADAPAVAVPFTGPVDDVRLRELVRAGLDVAELRIDRFLRPDAASVVDTAVAFAGVPTIATIRSRAEGGDWEGDDDERLALFKAVLPFVEGVDIELSSEAIVERVVDAARSEGQLVVVSHHDFEATPTSERLSALAEASVTAGADIVKVAATARSWDDVRTLARFTLDQAATGHVIVVAMGDHGALSRVLFPALGSALTFAHAGESSAPGQLGLGETVELLSRLGLART